MQTRQAALDLDGAVLHSVFDRMFASYGPQHWWPADSAFEVMVGSVLTQNAAWVNVEKAIANLKQQGLLDAGSIARCPTPQLAECLRPSGYFNVKAKRLAAFCQWYVDQGGFVALAALDTDSLRTRLLEVYGVGPETADDMVLYAFERPVFVIDAYTRRVFGRMGLIQGDEPYEGLRLGVERALGPDVALFNEYHALLVRHAKEACGARPRCDVCCFSQTCPASTAG